MVDALGDDVVDGGPFEVKLIYAYGFCEWGA
jgi:hypothetical protein